MGGGIDALGKQPAWIDDLHELRGGVAVVRGGAVVEEAYAGLAGDGAGALWSASTRCQVASVSKQFVAAAALSLVDDGSLALDQPVGRWLAGAPLQWREITLHHLLTHTAGFGHWADLEGFEIDEPGSSEELLRTLAQAPLLASPGAEWRYSGPGYVLVARLVEEAGGEPYSTAVESRVLAPLGMHSTTAGAVPVGAEVARGYREGREVRVAGGLSGLPGTGDVWSTVRDVARFGAGLGSGAILSPASRRAMLAPQTALGAHEPRDPVITFAGYGYGGYSGTVDGHTIFFHPGDNPGFASFSAWFPDDEVGVVLLSNEETTGNGVLHAALRAALA